MSPIPTNPEAFLERLRKRKAEHGIEFSDEELIDAIKALRSYRLREEVKGAFQGRDVAFITECLNILARPKSRPKELDRVRTVKPSRMLNLYPDKD